MEEVKERQMEAQVAEALKPKLKPHEVIKKLHEIRDNVMVPTSATLAGVSIEEIDPLVESLGTLGLAVTNMFGLLNVFRKAVPLAYELRRMQDAQTKGQPFTPSDSLVAFADNVMVLHAFSEDFLGLLENLPEDIGTALLDQIEKTNKDTNEAISEAAKHIMIKANLQDYVEPEDENTTPAVEIHSELILQ